MSEEIPYVFFQRQYGRKWTTYNVEEHISLNRAIQRDLKTVTLPCSNERKKITVTFDKMIQKNAVSGFEQNVRCVIFNSDYIVWVWKDDYENWISFTPRAAIMLEIAHVKKEENIELFIKDAYKLNLKDYLQTNLQTNYVRSIKREVVIDMDCPKGIDSRYGEVLEKAWGCEDFITKMSGENIERSKAIVFNLEYSTSDSQSSSPISAHSDIISALSAEAQASSSVQKEIVAVDPDCPKADQYHVYTEDDNVFNATLNFTNVIDNNNKYFIIQLLKKNKSNQYVVWFRWGRLGYKGQNNLVNCGGNLDEAKSEFEKKFLSKTGNHWSDRKNFKRIPTKYDLVHSNLAVEDPKLLTSVGSKLDIKVQQLLELISNRNNLEEAAKELCFDAKNTPLGKIQAKQILEGYDALNKITEIIKEQHGKINKKLIEACNNFYTKIPHDFKRKTPPILSTMHQVKEKLHMLEDLTQISLAYDVLDSSVDRSLNIIDKYYKRLECNITPVDHSSDKFQALTKYLIETHGSTHLGYNMELIDAFACEKTLEAEFFKDLGNKKLLWHGSRLSNWLGILKIGLKIAPPEAPSTGYMFGKGIYFADCSSKSANYCFATKKSNEGLLLLSEVALGRPKTVYEAEDCSVWMNDGFHSIFAPGRNKPKDFENTVLSPEAVVPVGPLVETCEEDNPTLQYNEYVVFDTNQVKMRYLLRIKFNFK